MARLLTTKDAHNIIDLVVMQMTGTKTQQTLSTKDFISAGELAMSYGKENVMNAITLVLGRTMVAARPKSMNFASINAINTGVYSHRIRKISFYSQYSEPYAFQNTDALTNFADGYDNNANGGASAKSMWEQRPAMPLEMNFAGSSGWDDVITRYIDKLEQAFNSEADFIAFIHGIVTEKQNDIEQQKEAFARMTVLNHMAAAYDANQILHNGMAYNMTKLFNDEMNTNYSTLQLQTTYKEEFLKFFTAKIAILKEDFKERDTLHHWSVPKTVSGVDYHILRHTPADRFRGIFSARFFKEAEAMVFPTVFNEQYLDNGKGYELVNYWQSRDLPYAIKVTPALPDIAGTNSGEQVAGTTVDLACVLGICFDVDALLIDFQLDRALTSPIEARKGYYNTWYHIQKNSISDITEKCAIFYMADDAVDGGSQLGII